MSTDGAIQMRSNLEHFLSVRENKVFADIYSFGVLMLFAILGGYTWKNTTEFPDLERHFYQVTRANLDPDCGPFIFKFVKRCLLLETDEE